MGRDHVSNGGLGEDLPALQASAERGVLVTLAVVAPHYCSYVTVAVAETKDLKAKTTRPTISLHRLMFERPAPGHSRHRRHHSHNIHIKSSSCRRTMTHIASCIRRDIDGAEIVHIMDESPPNWIDLVSPNVSFAW